MKASNSSELGFTLIELMVVITIIALLAAIAIPAFVEYKAKSFDSRAKADLRNVATAEEAYFSENEVYKTCSGAACASGLPGIGALSASVTLQITATASGFTGTSTSSNGSGLTYTWNSSNGGLQ